MQSAARIQHALGQLVTEQNLGIRSDENGAYRQPVQRLGTARTRQLGGVELPMDLNGSLQMRHECQPSVDFLRLEGLRSSKYSDTRQDRLITEDVRGGELQAALRFDPVVIELASLIELTGGKVVCRDEHALLEVADFLDKEILLRIIVDIRPDEAVIDVSARVETCSEVLQIVREEGRLPTAECFSEVVEENRPECRIDCRRVDLIYER
jgi:hypothetical protein